MRVVSAAKSLGLRAQYMLPVTTGAEYGEEWTMWDWVYKTDRSRGLGTIKSILVDFDRGQAMLLDEKKALIKIVNALTDSDTYSVSLYVDGGAVI